MYSVLCILGVFFVIGYVPETKGRDLDSIAKLFLKAKSEECVLKSDSNVTNKKKPSCQVNCDTTVEITRL